METSTNMTAPTNKMYRTVSFFGPTELPGPFETCVFHSSIFDYVRAGKAPNFSNSSHTRWVGRPITVK